MKEIREIEANILQYVFAESEDDPDMEVNLTVLLSADKALLIDTGFPLHARQVKNDLLKKNIEVEKVILTHYHPDHAAGACEFENIELACSSHYKENYKKCAEVWDPENRYKEADTVIQNHTGCHFGEFKLTFIEAPGHSKCSLIILINDTIAHVGDLLMSNAENKLITPYISEGGNFKEHINSLEKIRALNVERLILSHGNTISGRTEIEREIDKRAYYLQSVIDSEGKIDVESALTGGVSNWSYVEWHDKNLERLN
ncbi:MBL fold metallo-hydrolase [Marinifilum sp. D714]|uniref:MBL fold metallo-hydrolase n=1 Tax=Marinifilum sp. D714 TaxID=2937523 RepID=UPI0027D06471|nr:MBL fold metallo-hydrolase [Marinifilum sp. D714]MDQ2180465.1 MBL fold metallo-hydrolase [Marinifilum sp. D714]